MLAALAAAHLFKRFSDDQWVEAEGVLVDATVGQREGRGFAIGDHDDLAHVLVRPGQNALGDAQTFAGVGVVRPDLDARELADRDVLGGVVEEHEVDGVAGVLRADEVGERHGDALGRG